MGHTTIFFHVHRQRYRSLDICFRKLLIVWSLTGKTDSPRNIYLIICIKSLPNNSFGSFWICVFKKWSSISRFQPQLYFRFFSYRILVHFSLQNAHSIVRVRRCFYVYKSIFIELLKELLVPFNHFYSLTLL